MTPTRTDHDAALRICQAHRDHLSEAEFMLLNEVASAWACAADDWLTPERLAQARAVMARVEADILDLDVRQAE